MKIYLIQDKSVKSIDDSILYLGCDKAKATDAIKAIPKHNTDNINIKVFKAVNGKVTIHA